MLTPDYLLFMTDVILLCNVPKFEFMILTNKMIISSPDIYIGQFAVKRVKCFKYLAISIDIS